jgi:hypothetical protein
MSVSMPSASAHSHPLWPQCAVVHERVQTQVDHTVEQVKQLVSHVGNTATGLVENSVTMRRVANGLHVAASSVKETGRRLSELPRNSPVLTMSLGLAGGVSGGMLSSARTFSGAVLLGTSIYVIEKSLMPVLTKLAALVAQKKNVLRQAVQTPVQANEPEAECLAFRSDTLHEVFQALSQSQLSSRVALSAALSRSKAFSSHPDPLIQLSRAKALADLPKPEDVLDCLKLSQQRTIEPTALSALVGVLDRHLATLLKNTLALPEYIILSRDVDQLGQYMGRLLFTNPLLPKALFQSYFKVRTLSALKSLYSDPRMTNAVRQRSEISAWLEKMLTINRLQGDDLSVSDMTIEQRSDKDLMLAAVKVKRYAIQFAAGALEGDRELATAAVRTQGLALKYVSAEFQADRDVVIQAVRQHGGALEYASADLKADRGVVIEAVRQDGSALMYASVGLRADRGVVIEAVRQYGEALRYARSNLKADRGVVLDAVRQDGFALQYARGGLRGDRKVVIEAVRKDGFALQYARSFLRADRTVVTHALRDAPLALEYASTFFRADHNVLTAAVSNNGLALQYAQADLRGDRDVVLAAVRNDGLALQYAQADLRGDRDVVLAAVQNDGLALQYAQDDLRGDRDVVLAAVGNCGSVLRYTPSGLRADLDVVLTAVSNDGLAVRYAKGGLRADREVMLAAVNNNGLALEYAKTRPKLDREVVLAAVRNNARALQYASETLRADREIALSAVRKNHSMFGMIAADLKSDLEVLTARFEGAMEFHRELPTRPFFLEKSIDDFEMAVLKARSAQLN